MNRQFAPLLAVSAGILATVAIVATVMGMNFTNPLTKPRSLATAPSIHITSANLIALAIIVSLIMIASSLAVAFYWRAKSINAQIRQEDARRQREEAEKVLERLRDRMSLPSLVELNRLMLTEYHSIATTQAQKSFRSSQRAMLGGFTWLIACFTAAIFVDSFKWKDS